MQNIQQSVWPRIALILVPFPPFTKSSCPLFFLQLRVSFYQQYICVQNSLVHEKQKYFQKRILSSLKEFVFSQMMKIDPSPLWDNQIFLHLGTQKAPSVLPNVRVFFFSFIFLDSYLLLAQFSRPLCLCLQSPQQQNTPQQRLN